MSRDIPTLDRLSDCASSVIKQMIRERHNNTRTERNTRKSYGASSSPFYSSVPCGVLTVSEHRCSDCSALQPVGALPIFIGGLFRAYFGLSAETAFFSITVFGHR
ncbi:hypothetical protein AVEN_112106-1 [Araneus ventricosus]|uniref:Uncharacterized protein n=1 Tax=Araneus ventricosus TaxID=182803 RepID=A0A4Y2HW55_ARAVE|nr:hypothetical protein AVEN_112106-1 [Araneus ventricosus]